ncbi:MAG TPA: ATP-binding protein [Puia sp.]|nr:ATP-binding protein [Puia sp.]
MVKMLIVEDDPMDIELLMYELRKNELEYKHTVVQSKTDYETALANFKPDIILSDYNLPSFDAQRAFWIKQRVNPEIPFIIVSGAIGEENAVELIKNGVTDYVPKDKLFTIVPKIHRALQESSDRREKLEVKRRLVKERARYQKMLGKATVVGQEKERAEIGKELHDNINQMLSVIRLYLSLHLEGEDDGSPNLLEQGLYLIDTCIGEIRKISQALIPPPKEDGLIAAIEVLIERINMAKPFAIDFRHVGFHENDMDENQQLTIYRIIQEQLNNVIKHAGATRVDIELNETNNRILLDITDDGCGFDPHTKTTGVGINNMLSRVRLFDGDLRIISRHGAGCTLKVSLPKVHQAV